MSNIKKFGEFIVESLIDTDVIISFLNKQMNVDKKAYKGHIPTKYNKGVEWDDSGWISAEIYNFLNSNYASSYTLMKFGKTYEYDMLKDVLKKAYPIEFDAAINMTF